MIRPVNSSPIRPLDNRHRPDAARTAWGASAGAALKGLPRRIAERFRTAAGKAADAGMNTAEYAVGTLAAVAFAGILLKVLTSGNVQKALTDVIDRALQ